MLDQQKVAGLRFTDQLIVNESKQEIAKAAVSLAESISAKAIIVPTRRGRMANRVTNCHPQVSIICAFTDRASTMRQLMLNRNVLSYQIDFSDNPTNTQRAANNVKRKNLRLKIQLL